VTRIKKASEEEIAKIIGPSAAQNLLKALNSEI
jgi:hypothetical protein